MKFIDKWIGDNLFVPLIIKLCQTTEITQYRFHNTLSYVGIMLLLYTIVSSPVSATSIVVGILLLFSFVVVTAIMFFAPDKPFGESFLFRFIWIVLLISDILAYRDMVHLMTSVMFVFAQYALTIKDIPPENKEDKVKLGVREA